MLKTRSMTDTAYELMSKKKRAIPFKKLWEEVIAKLGLDPKAAAERIAQFYTDMTLDERFTSLKENKWDLKERHRFDEVHVELVDLDEDDDEEEAAYFDEDEDVAESEVSRKSEEEDY